MYVRGKQWTVTVDDFMLFNRQKNKPEHMEINLKKPSMWGSILEKGWSKIDGTFLSSEAGFTFQAMRAVLGCPVAYYFTATTRLTSRDLWMTIRSQMTFRNYMFIATTDPNKENPDQFGHNECGITTAHAFPVLNLFPLYNEYYPDKVDHMLYMMRDPRGPN